MSTTRRTLGFSWPVLIVLAALAAPRVVLHDLGIQEGSLVNGLFVFVPPAIWIAAVLWRRPPRPFATLVVTGAIYGMFLAVGHQLLWGSALAGTGSLGGGGLAYEGVMRAAAIVSSLVTGTLVGAVTGAVTLLLQRVLPATQGGHPQHRTR